MSHSNVKLGRHAFNANSHGQQLLVDINDKMRLDLADIKTNTANVNINTDTLEEKLDTLNDRIGIDSSGTPLSQTALLRVQKDVIDSKLGSVIQLLDNEAGNTIYQRLVDNNTKLDSLNDKIGVDTSGSPLSQTALLRVQKDVIDSKLGSVITLLDNGVGNTIYQRLVDNNTKLDALVNPQLIARTDIADNATSTNLKTSATGSLYVKQDDHASVVAQGVSDQSNPFGTKKPLLIDTAGKLEVVNTPNIVRGVLVAESGAPATKWVDNSFGTTIIDTLYHSKIYLNYSGGQNDTHAFELHGSNDNSTYYKVEAFTQTDASGLLTHTSTTSGFRYFKVKNVGGDIATTQGGIYNSFS